MIDSEDYWYFVERALGGMRHVVAELGDDLANRRPPLVGGNSAYALLHHCVGVIDAWVGGFIAGRPVERDRTSEFSASGPVAALLTRVDDASERFRADLAVADPTAPLTQQPPSDFEGPDRSLTVGGVLQHVYEELAQHHGQMEQIRDLVLAVDRGALVVTP
jgi:uncharacterized damage-inducible protein DinB